MDLLAQVLKDYAQLNSEASAHKQRHAPQNYVSNIFLMEFVVFSWLEHSMTHKVKLHL